jgi:hypothetical protein
LVPPKTESPAISEPDMPPLSLPSGQIKDPIEDPIEPVKKEKLALKSQTSNVSFGTYKLEEDQSMDDVPPLEPPKQELPKQESHPWEDFYTALRSEIVLDPSSPSSDLIDVPFEETKAEDALPPLIELIAAGNAAKDEIIEETLEKCHGIRCCRREL